VKLYDADGWARDGVGEWDYVREAVDLWGDRGDFLHLDRIRKMELFNFLVKYLDRII
jgi:hypothetical protein